MVKIQGVHTLTAHWWTERGATLAWHTKLSLLLSLCAKRQECFNCCVFASSWVDTFRELSNYWACLQPFTNTCGSLLVVKSLSGPPTEEIAFPLFADWSAKYLQNQIWAFGKISDAVLKCKIEQKYKAAQSWLGLHPRATIYNVYSGHQQQKRK